MSSAKIVFPFASGQRLVLRKGNITAIEADVIVNAANEQLEHGGGVAAAISRCGGPEIQNESREWVRGHGLVTHDSPAYTTAGNLPFKYIIHAVGPLASARDADGKLRMTILCSLNLAEDLDAGSLAFPALSTGIFGFPKFRAGKVFMQAIDSYFNSHPKSKIDCVYIVLFSSEDFDIFTAAFNEYFVGKSP